MPPRTRQKAIASVCLVIKEEESTVDCSNVSVRTRSRYFQSTTVALHATRTSSTDDTNDDDKSAAKRTVVKDTYEKASSKRSKRAGKAEKVGTPSTPPNSKPSTKKPRSPPKKKQKVTVSRDPPKDWELVYSLVEELRQDRSAPVDSDGGHALPQRDRGDVIWRFQILMALMLSSQTKDAVVGDTMRALQKYGLDVENIHATSAEQLNKLIGKVGFHNNKTNYIKQAVQIMLEEYNGDIPPNAQELMKLPGVGPKMAFIIESVAFGTTSGIGVDTHMHRMYNQLKWVSSKNPEQTRVQLESWLPRDKWPTVNVLWVGLGQEVQQFKSKIIRKALDCTRPAEALRLLARLGVDLNKEGKKLGLEEEIKIARKGVKLANDSQVDVRNV